MGEVIVITSGKGGVGKTTSSANIGAALAALNKSVVIIDADIGLRNLDIVMGLENRIVYDLVDIVEGKCRVKQALVKDKRFENLYLIAASQSKTKDAVNPSQMIELCETLKENFDFIIIDCPAGIEQGFENAIAAANFAIVVANPEVSSVRDADTIVGKLSAAGIQKVMLVLNRLRPNLLKKEQMLSLDDVVEILAIDVLGIVPEDETIIISTNRGEPASTQSDSRAGEAFRHIAQRILGEDIPMMDLEQKENLFGKIKKIFGR